MPDISIDCLVELVSPLSYSIAKRITVGELRATSFATAGRYDKDSARLDSSTSFSWQTISYWLWGDPDLSLYCHLRSQ